MKNVSDNTKRTFEQMAYYALGVLGATALACIGYAADVAPFAKIIGALTALLPTVFFIECAKDCGDRKRKSETAVTSSFKSIASDHTIAQNDNRPMLLPRRVLAR